ncbi:MAG: SMI1/KNR4 family protein [Lachnospiraceae bacterium]|nr:SMI1/KNR4 family protein [Lachnospiraceae bacterium]
MEVKKLINTFMAYMKEHGWNIEVNEMQNVSLPEAITSRYTNIPKQWLEFAKNIKQMISADETMWFLCSEDFNMQEIGAFQWNEWELISLESAKGDTEWENEIKKFWDNHLPIVMSVKGGYSYYAISIKDGSVIHGAEPEFAECEAVASSFTDFMEKIVKNELQL